ncbi:MAG: uroporphyrinogen-III synthase [Chloroflexota bacterium]
MSRQNRGDSMGILGGARVALLEARMSGQLSDLVRRHGGEPRSAPAVREVPRESRAEVAGLLNSLGRGGTDIVVFLTGAGVDALFSEADALGRATELWEKLGQITTVCRGPKPLAAMRRHGLLPSVRVQEPYTATETLDAMGRLPIQGATVGLIHYGERNGDLASALEARGARLKELCLYEWLLPEDTAPLFDMARTIIAGDVDAAAFTSRVQARHLFQVAAEQGRAEALAHALNNTVVTAAVGPTCAAALEEHGVKPHVTPDHPKMGHMVLALGERVSQLRSREARATA